MRTQTKNNERSRNLSLGSLLNKATTFEGLCEANTTRPPSTARCAQGQETFLMLFYAFSAPVSSNFIECFAKNIDHLVYLCFFDDKLR